MTSENFTKLETNLSLDVNNIHHASDELGVMVGLERLSGESAGDFRQRILDVFVHPAGGDPEGLVIGANRELGFVLERALVISVKNTVDLFAGPKIDVGNSSITLYSSWNVDGTKTQEMSIDIFNEFKSDRHDYHARYLIELVTTINTFSNTFEASLASSAYSYYLASSLIPTTSTRLGASERIREKFHKLSNEQVLPGSIVLSPSKFRKRKFIDMNDWDTSTDFVGPSVETEYWVDLEKGILLFGDNPASIGVGYMYNELPLTIYSAPIEIYPFADKNFNRELNTLDIDAFGNVITSIPTASAAGWINNLYQEARHFWGGTASLQTPEAAHTELTDILDNLETDDISEVEYTQVPKRNFVSLKKQNK